MIEDKLAQKTFVEDVKHAMMGASQSSTHVDDADDEEMKLLKAQAKAYMSGTGPRSLRPAIAAPITKPPKAAPKFNTKLGGLQQANAASSYLQELQKELALLEGPCRLRELQMISAVPCWGLQRYLPSNLVFLDVAQVPLSDAQIRLNFLGISEIRSQARNFLLLLRLSFPIETSRWRIKRSPRGTR